MTVKNIRSYVLPSNKKSYIAVFVVAAVVATVATMILVLR